MARGHISQRSTGSWRLVVSAGVDPSTGKVRQRTKTVRGSRREAERELTALLREVDQGIVTDPGRATVDSYLERWLEHVATRVRPRTHERYASLTRRHVYDGDRDRPVEGPPPRPHPAFLDRMASDGLAPRTRIQCYRVLSEALSQAVLVADPAELNHVKS